MQPALPAVHPRGRPGIKYTDYDLLDFQACRRVGGGKYNMIYGRDEMAVAAMLVTESARACSYYSVSAGSHSGSLWLYHLGREGRGTIRTCE